MSLPAPATLLLLKYCLDCNLNQWLQGFLTRFMMYFRAFILGGDGIAAFRAWQCGGG